MTYLFIGAGQAGGAIVDSIFDHTDDSLLGLSSSPDISTMGRPLAFNSTIRDLQNLSNIPVTDQYGIAAGDGIVEATKPGFEEIVTGGFGRDPVRSDEVMSEHASQLQSILDEKFDRKSDDAGSGPAGSDAIQFAFLFLGLGGGTGCGISPHLAREIREFAGDQVRIIAVVILPNTRKGGQGDDVPSAGRQAWNARYGLDRLEDEVDGIVLIDNQRISHLDSAGGEFGTYNEYVASAIHDLVVGSVLRGVDSSEFDGIDTPDIDVNDIATSLSFGVGDGESKPGYAAIGRSVTMTRSLAGYLLPFVGKQAIDSDALSRLSTSKQTLADADVTDAQKAISLIRAPSSHLGDGKYGIETGTIARFLEDNCALSEVNLGVAVDDRNLASVTTLLTYRREDLDRLAEIDDAAETYETETEELLV